MTGTESLTQTTVLLASHLSQFHLFGFFYVHTRPSLPIPKPEPLHTHMLSERVEIKNKSAKARPHIEGADDKKVKSNHTLSISRVVFTHAQYNAVVVLVLQESTIFLLNCLNCLGTHLSVPQSSDN